MKVRVIDLDRDTKRYIYLALGAVLVILGLILIFDFIIQFIRLLIGLALIAAGVFLLNYDKYWYRFKFLRF